MMFTSMIAYGNTWGSIGGQDLILVLNFFFFFCHLIVSICVEGDQ